MVRLPAVLVKKTGPAELVLKLPSTRAFEVFALLPKGKDEGYVKVQFSKPGKPMTTGLRSQCNCIHGWCAVIAQWCGHEVDEIKTAMKQKAESRGYPVKYVLGKPVPASLSEITTVQAAALIETIVQFAAENEILLPEYEEEDKCGVKLLRKKF